MGNNYKSYKSAFTIAEILITLSIIGVVAAITLPNMFTNFKKRETITKVKAAYSIFSQAVKLSSVDNEAMNGWDFTLSENEFMKTYILPYLTGVSVAKLPKNYTLNTLTTAWGDYYDIWGRTAYQLQNGMIFWYSNARNGDKYTKFVVDINGTAKPNVLGIDGFVFSLDTEKSAIVTAGSWLSRDKIKNGEVRSCARDKSWQYYRGGYCAALIQRDGWTISSDYPWGNGNIMRK